MNMKKLFNGLVLAIALVAFFAAPTHAQLSKKTSKKLTKQAKKEAKDLEKKGYYVPPGGLPLAVKLEQAYNRQAELDENSGYPKYIVGSATAIGGTKIAAKNQAMEAAKLELAGKVESNIAALTEQSIANEQLTQEEAASITETVTAAKNIISQKLGRVILLFEAYRDVSSKNVESIVRIAYNSDMALEVTKETIRDELRKKSEDLHKKLDNMLNLDGEGGQ